MFDALKGFIAEVAGAEAPARSFGEEDYRLAAVALLIHVANVDGETDLAERRRLKTIIEERFGLDAKAASELNHDGRAKRPRGRRSLPFHQRPETRARRRWMPENRGNAVGHRVCRRRGR